jgi:hypothetical protein
MSIKEPIACSRTYSSERGDLVVTITVPVYSQHEGDPEPMWNCYVYFDGWGALRRTRVYGLDSLSAVQSAMGLMKGALQIYREQLTWRDVRSGHVWSSEPGDWGLPPTLTTMVNYSIHRALEKHIKRIENDFFLNINGGPDPRTSAQLFEEACSSADMMATENNLRILCLRDSPEEHSIANSFMQSSDPRKKEVARAFYSRLSGDDVLSHIEVVKEY